MTAVKKRLESGFSVLREAVPAIDGSTFGRLERNFALFAAVGTDRLVELTGAVVIGTGAPAGISLFHWNFTHSGIQFIRYSEPGLSVLREAVEAVDGSTLRRLERNFTRFAAVTADCFVELSGPVLERSGAPAGVSLFHILQPCR